LFSDVIFFQMLVEPVERGVLCAKAVDMTAGQTKASNLLNSMSMALTI